MTEISRSNASPTTPGESQIAPSQFEMFNQFSQLEQLCLAPWQDPETGNLPDGWRSAGYAVSVSDFGINITLELSSVYRLDDIVFSAALDGFRSDSDEMRHLVPTNIGVSYFNGPSVEHVDAPQDDPHTYTEEEILKIYSDFLEIALNPNQEGVRMEVRFSTVRQSTSVATAIQSTTSTKLELPQ